MMMMMMMMPREAVIVAVDAKRSNGGVETVEWAFKYLVRPGDILLVLVVLNDDHLQYPKKPSCFPFNFLFSTSTCERSEMVDDGDLDYSVEIKETYEKRKGEYQTSLKTISRQCRSNKVMLQLKFAAGYCPARLSMDEARNLNTRWILLDSHFRKSRLFLRGHVRCNIAVMKGKDFATLMLSDNFHGNPEENKNSSPPTDSPIEVPSRSLSPEQLKRSRAPAPHPQNPCCYPLSWRTGFPRVFTHNELEVITNGFADDDISTEGEGMKVYLGILKETTVLVKSYEEVNDGFRLMLKILARLSHRNILNLVGYCYTGAAAYLILDFPCLGNIEANLQCEELAQKLGWKARWSIALEIGASLRYLHEECADEPIIHKAVCSCSVMLSHDYSAMLSDFKTAEWLEGGDPLDIETISRCSNFEQDERLFVDVRGYGAFLLELITGKSACCFPNQGKESLIDWVRSLGNALPLLEKHVLRDLMDRRVTETSGDARLVRQMAHAALCCLKVDSDHKLSISEALAIVRGDELAVSNQALQVFE